MRDENSFTFSGPFQDVIPLYIQHKHACGYKVAESDLYRLKEMDAFFEKRGITYPVITKDMYSEWTSLREGERPVTMSRRISIIRGLGKYMAESGYQNIYTGKDDRRYYESDYIPYIFSTEEIRRVFREINRNCNENPTYLNHSFRILMSLYYCCGLRKSEAVSLRIKDIDFKTGKICIMNSKGNVSRIVVASDSLLTRMVDYFDTYCTNYTSSELFIKNSKGGVYTRDSLYKQYHNLLKQSGIPERADGRIHRLHDMRHTFCVHTLEQMQKKGFDLYTSLPLLSTYLGHKHIRETEYYLHLVEEYHESLLTKTENYCPSLFPKEVYDDKK
jgi:integrase